VLPFISVHEISDDRIVRWHDYWDLTTLMNTAPQWWIEHIMNGY
jgi:limonene-1,2-epoxide hydrolase